MKDYKEVRTEIIRKVLENYKVNPEGELAIYLSDNLSKYDGVRTNLIALINVINIEKLNFDKRVLELTGKADKLREMCDHPVTEYFGDPAGGNSGFSECSVCGKRL